MINPNVSYNKVIDRLTEATRTHRTRRFVKIPSRRRACVRALREIRQGEEIYASYGPCYWSVGGKSPHTPVGGFHRGGTPPR